MRLSSLYALALLGVSAGCHSNSGGTGPLPPGHNVLFVGNSLTYENDLPGMFRDLALSGGDDYKVRSLAEPNRALVDYVLNGSIQPIVSQTRWEYIVMQQGPTTVPVCRDTLVLAVKAIDQLGRKVGARSVSMMSWPAINRQFDFPKVHESFFMAANEVGGLFAPVGDAWQIAMANDPTIKVYGADGYHPGVVGTYLAALVVYEQVTGKDARTLPPDAPIAGGASIPRETVIMLQNAAHTANVNVTRELPPVWVKSTPTGFSITC